MSGGGYKGKNYDPNYKNKFQQNGFQKQQSGFQQGGFQKPKGGFQKPHGKGGYTIKITGYPQNLDWKTLLGFLNSNVKFRFTNKTFSSTMATITVSNPEEMNGILQLNGTVVSGHKLIIQQDKKQGGGGGFQQPKPKPSKVSFNAQQVSQYLYSSKYDSSKHIIHLDNLHSTPLQQMIQNIDLNNPELLKQLCFLFQNEQDKITAINFSNNGIYSLSGFQNLRKYFKNCVNLCFDGNLISDFNELNYIADSDQMSPLREVSFRGNPIQTQNQNDVYSTEVLNRFPNLKYHDSSEVKQIKFVIPTEKIELPQPKGSFFDTENNQKLVYAFFEKFFAAYDSDRDNLTNAYHENSTFTLSVGLQEGRVDGKDSFEQLKYVAKLGRNLLTDKDIDKRQKTIFHKRIPILYFMTQLPKTQHDLGGIIIDAHTLSIPNQASVIFVSMHGKYKNQYGFIRCFDRTFILAPPSQNSGFPAVILNDELHIRPDTNSKNDKIQQVQMSQQPQQQQNQNVQNQAMLKQLMNETGMNEPYAKKCLNDSGWNYAKAKEFFAYYRNQLPKDAFQ
eukprot:gene6792-10956_t